MVISSSAALAVIEDAIMYESHPCPLPRFGQVFQYDLEKHSQVQWGNRVWILPSPSKQQDNEALVSEIKTHITGELIP